MKGAIGMGAWTRRAAAWLVCGLLSTAALAADPKAPPGPDAASLQRQLEDIGRQVEIARNNIDLVEKQYTLREEPTEEAARNQRFSDAEIQYLLGDYANAAVLCYDLVANTEFRTNSHYDTALFYLADSLYQQKNYLGARLYLRQLLQLRKRYYKEALARYLEIAGRLNEFTGIDEFITQAKGLSGGTLPPELTYVYAKWLFRRDDMGLEERVAKAQTIFQTLADAPGGPFRVQAAYFIGVGYVKVHQWEKAQAQFDLVKKMAPRDDKDKKVLELANLSEGRVAFEMGKFDEAIDRYAQVPQQSDNFPDALYEVSWAYVRKGEYQKAKNATDILLLVAEDSVLAPEAKILQGTLLQKMQKYDDSVDTYNQVINTYAPVRDEIDALLTVNKDPVQYFDELLQRNEKSLDVTRLLPPIALKWASTARDVADAQDIANALDASRKGLTESRQIADRILESLDKRGLESFPMLQEGFTRADAVDTAVTRAEENLTRLEADVSDSAMGPEKKQRLAELRQKAQALKDRIDTLPTTTDELEARRKRMQEKIDEIDKRAYQAGLEIQAQQAQLTAIRKYVDDTRSQRHNTAEDEKAFLEKVTNEQRALDGMQAEVDAMRARLAEERNNANAAVSGEDALRKEYADLLKEERSVVEESRGQVSGDLSQLLLKSDVVRTDALAVRERVQRAKQVIRERVGAKAQKLRDQVLAEQRLIETYSQETDAVTGETRNLVGRIAFDSFRRVRQSFYDLVLKADVGVVDVAFQRKQDKTAQIQKLAAQKDHELKQLDEEFKEVLKDVE